jgi:peptidoglycan/xylan/chitin deacetylase (PgdA/CDA1 family)
LDALRKRGIKPTVAVDAMTAEQYPELIEQLKSDGAEALSIR